jgi:5-methylcytosine-specific restriction endonuclease McrA
LNLAALIAEETGAALEQIMYLRHSNKEVPKLLRCGVSIEELSSIHEIGSIYDYMSGKRPSVSVVVVIVFDRVYGVYEVAGVETTGTFDDIATAEFQSYAVDLVGKNIQCRKYHLTPVQSICLGLSVRGWEGKGISRVQRHDLSLFHNIDVGPADSADLKDAIDSSFRDRVAASAAEQASKRAARLTRADALPRRVAVTSYVYLRNPDVVAQALEDSGGICQLCGLHAPFVSRHTGRPFLEVHHKHPLHLGGADTVENAIAVCPNCHRKEHHG